MNAHLDHLRKSVMTGLVTMIADIIGLEFVHNTNIKTEMLFSKQNTNKKQQVRRHQSPT